MSEFNPELFEKELARFKPAKPPEDFVRRLVETAAVGGLKSNPESAFPSPVSWWTWLRWAAPACAALVTLVGLIAHKPPPHPSLLPLGAGAGGSRPINSNRPLIQADNIEIDRQLISTFDAVGQLPDGEPVRLRCRQWVDGVILRDSARGVVIERQAPRFEIVPVRFETY